MTSRVAMFSLGGTIAMTQQSGAGGVQPALSPGDLLAAVPELGDLGIAIDMHDFRRILLSARIQFLVEMVLVEVTAPTMTRPREPRLFDVPLLRFDRG